MLRKLANGFLRLFYGFRAYNVPAADLPGPVLLLPNHVSWWDWLIIGACLPEDWRFVTSSTAAEVSRLHRFVMVNRRTFPVDMNSPYAVKHMAEYLQKGGRLVLFPEGRISTTGSLMKLFEGTGFLLHKTHAKIITARIRGAERLPLSRNPNQKQWFPRVSVHFSDVLTVPEFAERAVHVARAHLTEWLRSQMVHQHFYVEMQFGPPTLPRAIAEAARRNPARVVLQDATLQEVTYRRLLTGAEALSGQWRNLFAESGPRVGVLLPNVNAAPVVMLSLWLARKVPAVLNYTTGPRILLQCAQVAGLKHIITSRSFIERAKLDLQSLEAKGIKLVFLEDVRAQISRGNKFRAVLRRMSDPCLRKLPTTSADTAAILFTSGSEGEPKAVELTHENLLANIRQMLSVIDLVERDRFFNALPLFHSFGLTVGVLLPMVQGVFVFLYLSPLHYRVVPAALYNLNCTVFFGTNTFLMGYARKAHPYDFHTVRYLFAGAEKLQESTSRLWMQKFGVRVLEGYGATECSPCVSVNLPMHPRPGSAGQFLPGIEHKLEPVPGINGNSEPAGRLLVRGPNVMRGYLNPEANARFQALGGWYDTGDIARIDADGFLHILGRLKRFAKISGEMVSLSAVEEALACSFPEFGPKFAAAVVTVPDVNKGEKLVAVTNEPKLTLEQIRSALHARGLSNLAVPRQLRVIHELPRLGTGKLDHRELERRVRENANAGAETA